MPYENIVVSQPPKGQYWKCKEMIGHRVVVFGTHSIEEQPDTMNPGKTRRVATVDWADLDDGRGGVIQWAGLIDKPGVVNKLVGQQTAILGRLIQGDAKAGQSAPFILDDHQPGDAEYFTNVWLPANRDALAGKAAQNIPGTPPATAAQPQMPQYQPQPQPQMPQPQYQAPVAPAAPQYQQQPQMQPAMAAAAPAGLPNGVTPEAMAAFQAMVDRGEIVMPTH